MSSPTSPPLPVAGLSAGLRPARSLWIWLLCSLLGGGPAFLLNAYPPAPFHLFYGMLRDEYGVPIDLSGAEVYLETAGGVKISTTVNPGIETAANYRLEVPMDAGLLAAPYRPSALRPLAAFRLKVRIAGVVYLPIEMLGDFSQLGKPGQRTRLDLTLGEDSNGDGLPDAWQRLIDADLSKVRPGDSAGNGLTYLQEYYAGTYAIDPKAGFDLSIVGFNNGAPLVEFLAIVGRSYTVTASIDMKSWTPQTFSVPAEGASAPARQNYQTTTLKKVRLQVPVPAAGEPVAYYRLLVQ